jgi:phosphoenolpyruvate carboxykinase (GTP)
MPLIYQSFDWIHGVFIGATLSSETTAAASGAVGRIRHDPMAMLPFCGYNMGRYFHHWLKMRRNLQVPPRIFHVNWFRRDENGRFLWPGFGENMRVLKWIVDRCQGRAGARESALGWVPGPGDFDLAGMENFDASKLAKVQEINLEEWRRESLAGEELAFKLRADTPKELVCERELLLSRL